jgi:hypothetical protein
MHMQGLGCDARHWAQENVHDFPEWNFNRISVMIARRYFFPSTAAFQYAWCPM